MGDQMAFEKRDVRAKVNGNRGPGIGERKLGEEGTDTTRNWKSST